MLTRISLLTALEFAILYPLGFWLHAQDPIVPGFRRFNLGLSCFVGGMAVAGLFFQDLPPFLLTLASAWLLVSLFLAAFFWKKNYVNLHALMIPVLIGIVLLGQLYPAWIGTSPQAVWSPLLGSAILCAVTFATVLGHWYLNEPGLPLKHLHRATNVLWLLVFFRALADGFLLAFGKTFYRGESVSIYSFAGRMDGFLLWVAFGFGILFPLISTFFVRGCLLAKSTQSATGILYAILLAVFMGELTYKYYLVAFGLAL